MDRASPDAYELARQLFAREAGTAQTPVEMAEMAERVIRKLYQELAKMIGPAGFAAIISRALRKSQDDYPFLEGVVFETLADGRMEGLRERLPGQPPMAVTSSIIAILANFIWLLMTLIGKDLTLRQLRDVWPSVSFSQDDGIPGEPQGGTDQ